MKGLWDQSVAGMAQWREGKRVLERPKIPAATLRRRRALEKDAAKWLRHYFPRIFRLPFGSVHREIIDAVEYTIRTGGRCAVAAPRGTGKSYLLDGMALLAVVRGNCRFPVVIPWDAGGLKKALNFWVKALCHNDLFTSDYLDLCAPFRESKGSAMRCMTYADEHGKAWGAKLVVSQGLIVLPDSRGLIGGSTINGNPLGLHYTTDSGDGLRPDMVLIDDPQDAETANSQVQVGKTISLIDKDIAGMIGPDTTMPMMMACTVKQKQDVAEHYLSKGSGWRAVRVGQILTWPKHSDLWDAWDVARVEGEENKDCGKAALAFYKANKAKMDEGLTVSWDSRKSKGQPNAGYSAMVDYYVMGKEAFMSERQNDPQEAINDSPYTITPELICSRTDRGLPPRQVPDWTQAIVAITDVNISYALSTVVVAFGSNQRSHVLWYGTHPMSLRKDDAPAIISRTVQTELAVVGKQLAGMTCRPGWWGIDGGGTPQDTVINFCGVSVRACGLQAYTMFGRDAKGYRPTGKHKMVVREQIHLVSETMARRWLIWNADYWREIAQLGWASAPGLPGSASLCAGNHREFGEQICGERLAWKRDTPTGTRWEWKMLPGKHDFGDCMAMAYAAAAFGGIGTGVAVQQPRQQNVRRVRHISV